MQDSDMLFWGPLEKNHLRSEITSCIYDREAYSRSGEKEIFDDFSH